MKRAELLQNDAALSYIRQAAQSKSSAEQVELCLKATRTLKMAQIPGVPMPGPFPGLQDQAAPSSASAADASRVFPNGLSAPMLSAPASSVLTGVSQGVGQNSNAFNVVAESIYSARPDTMLPASGFFIPNGK
jgi:hypothetical protein